MVKFSSLGIGSIQEKDREPIKDNLPAMTIIAFYLDKKTKYAKEGEDASGILKFDARINGKVMKFRTTGTVLIKQFSEIAKSVGLMQVKDPETGVIWSKFKEEVEIDGIELHAPSVAGRHPYPTIKVNLP